MKNGVEGRCMHSGAGLAIRVLAAAVVALAGVVTAADERITPAAPQDPALLFRASFDKGIDEADVATGQAEFVPCVYDRSPLWKAQGVASWQRSKDYLRFRASHEKEGRKGGCLNVPRGKGQRFRALGNVTSRQGTISLWVKFGRALSTAHAPIISVGGTRCSMRVRYKTVNGHAGGIAFGLKQPKWEPNRWYHFALVYDCYQGGKIYVDGKLSRRRSRWGKAEYGWQTDSQFADLLSLAAGSYRGSSMPIMFDEVECYSQPLAADEIARLAAGKSVSERPKTERAASASAFRKHRLEELGWDLPGDYLAVKLDAPEPLHVRKVGVTSSRDVRAWRLGAVDGRRATRWPASYQGYGIANRGLHLGLEKGARIDYLMLRGDFEGWVYRGLDIAEPPKDKALLKLKSPGKFMRLTLKEPIESDGLSFFRVPPTKSEKMDNLGRRWWSPATYIYELGMFRVGDPAEAISRAEATLYYLTPQPYEAKERWVKWALQSHYEPLDRIALKLAPEAPSNQGRLRLRALRHAHLFVPERDTPTPMAGLRVTLSPRGLLSGTRVRVQVHNPVDITCNLLDLDIRLEPGATGRAPKGDVVLDLQDFIIPAGQPLWITLTPERNLDLALGETRIGLLTRPREEVQVEHVRNMLNYAKDRFIHVSEPRPWGHVPMKHCGERLLPFRQLDFALVDLKRNVPRNEKLFGLWAWTHPKETHDTSWLKPSAAPGAPKWALYAKEAMKKYRAFVLWWIENRQIPIGLFGSNYGDDSDLINDWLSIGLICDPDGRIADSVRRIGDYCWLEGPTMNGINRRHTDSLHAYEEGINIQPHQALLHYGNPVYLERLMESSRTVRDYLTYTLPDGKRFFKACWYGATHIDTEFERGTDILTNALMLHPTLIVAYYSRNKGAMKLLSEWAGTWAGLQTDAFEKNGLKGPFPVRAKYPTGEIVGTTSRYMSGYGYQSTCLGMYRMTGEEKYFTPIRTWIDNGSFSYTTATDWMAIRDPKPYRKKIVEIADAVNWDALNPSMGDDSRCTYSYLAWLVTGDKKYIEPALKNSWKRIAALFPMHTWAEQSADRVAVSKTMVDRIYLGGKPGLRNRYWPSHTVSWKGFNDEFAAWVLQTRPDYLRVWVYNFEPKPQTGELRVWGLDPGTYDVRIGPDANEDERMDSAAAPKQMALARNVPIPLTLPSRGLMLVEVKQRAKLAPQWPRPDLAVVTTDMQYDRDKGGLAIVVHNVGSAPARDFTVTIAVDGKVVATHKVPLLEAPNDLVPRTKAFTQNGLRGAGRVTVAVDPDNRIAEIWEENNRAVFDLGG